MSRGTVINIWYFSLVIVLMPVSYNSDNVTYVKTKKALFLFTTSQDLMFRDKTNDIAFHHEENQTASTTKSVPSLYFSGCEINPLRDTLAWLQYYQCICKRGNLSSLSLIKLCESLRSNEKALQRDRYVDNVAKTVSLVLIPVGLVGNILAIFCLAGDVFSGSTKLLYLSLTGMLILFTKINLICIILCTIMNPLIMQK